MQELLSPWSRGAPPWKLSERRGLRVSRHEQLLAQSPAPLPEDGGGAQSATSNPGSVFLVTSPHPEPTQSCLIRTKDAAITRR